MSAAGSASKICREPSAARFRKRGFIALQAAAWFAGALGVGFAVLSWAVLDNDERWAPVLGAIPSAMICVALSSVVLLVGWLALRRPLQRTRHSRLLTVASVVGQLFAVGASATAILYANPEVLSGPRQVDQMHVPSSSQVTYLYETRVMTKTGWSCAYHLYCRGPGAFVLEHERTLAPQPCPSSAPASLRWHKNRVVVWIDGSPWAGMSPPRPEL